MGPAGQRQGLGQRKLKVRRGDTWNALAWERREGEGREKL